MPTHPLQSAPRRPIQKRLAFGGPGVRVLPNRNYSIHGFLCRRAATVFVRLIAAVFFHALDTYPSLARAMLRIAYRRHDCCRSGLPAVFP